MFTEVLFRVAKIWKQLKCPSTDDRTHTHTEILLSHKKNKILSITATRVDLESTVLREVF